MPRYHQGDPSKDHPGTPRPGRRGPLFAGILPPYLLQRVAEHGSEPQRRRAGGTLSLDAGFRAEREGFPPGSSPSLRGAPRSAPGEKRRAIFDCGNTTQLPGELVRVEGAEPTPDPAVEEAYAGLGATYDLYRAAYGRNSIDGEGLPLLASVHYGREYANAFFDGERMVFGDGDGELLRRFTVAVDIIGHELSHGVVEDEAALIYSSQSGALNESISDVFGSLIKQRLLGHSAEQADWLIGEGLFTEAVDGVALRSMAAPGTAYDDEVLGEDPQPATMDGYVETEEDRGGVHINSGIPNHAFYLAATALGGYAREEAGRIWYQTLTDPALAAGADFAGFARLTASVAGRLYGEGSTEQRAVQEAWNGVGVGIQ